MKTIFFLPFVFFIVLTACTKSDELDRCAAVTLTAPDAEVATLKAYIDSNHIDATEDSRGFFYHIVSTGDSSKHPSSCSNVTVSYTGRLLNGTQFDAQNGAKLLISNLIPGWKEGIPMIGTGGTILLYIPPSLGYGATVTGSIPANSNLFFAIELIAVE